MAVVRSSLHLLRYSKTRSEAPPPRIEWSLPPAVLLEDKLAFDTDDHGLYDVVASLLQRCSPALGSFPSRASEAEAVPAELASAMSVAGEGDAAAGSVAVSDKLASKKDRIEEFTLDSDAWSSAEKQELLTRSVLDDSAFHAAYERLVREVVVPYMKARLVAADPSFARELRFYYQFPPTVRLQPGPSERYVKAHRDGEYGHQEGELNFWMPLTPPSTQTTLWVESQPDLGDYHPLELDYGTIGVFHGTLCRHHVPANPTSLTRVSLDFRVGVEGAFDPAWVYRGTKADHVRRSLVF
eukprot:TRINITY_DN47220_c0_g1_i1.p1 TRINITY_DN47220_c0_g1~~TRINITY_DN47220_c0_g1_i1.p1  ORF type:complete len:324 (-),score=49.21 TRINITY_DN47220_c0_g1_i1:9-899(-)